MWRDMTAIKINILQRMDTAPLSVRICCIKFLQKVVQVQTPGQIADPRVSLGFKYDIKLMMVETGTK